MLRDKKYNLDFAGDAEKPVTIDGKPVSMPEGMARLLAGRSQISRNYLMNIGIAEFCPPAPRLPEGCRGDVRYYGHAGKEALFVHVLGILSQRQMLIDDLDMKMEIRPVGAKLEESKNREGKTRTRIIDTYEIVLANMKSGKDMKIPYRTGIACRVTEYEGLNACSRVSIHDLEQAESTARVVSPLPLDILECVMSEDFRGLTFEDWCDEYGYDADSRSALKTYEEVRDQTLKFNSLFPYANLCEYRPLLIHCGDEVDEDRSELPQEKQWAGYLDYLRQWSAPLVSPSGFDEWLAGDDGQSETGRPLEGEEEEKAEAYMRYLADWADDHSDMGFMGCSPAGCGEWLENEWQEHQSKRAMP